VRSCNPKTEGVSIAANALERNSYAPTDPSSNVAKSDRAWLPGTAASRAAPPDGGRHQWLRSTLKGATASRSTVQTAVRAL